MNKNILMKAIHLLFIVLFGLSISSWSELIFEDTQPKGLTSLTTFPDFLAGEFVLVIDSTTVSDGSIFITFLDKHTIELLVYSTPESDYKCILDLKKNTYKDDGFFNFENPSGKLVMKTIEKDFYCLNFQHHLNDEFWTVFSFRLIENNNLEIKFPIKSIDIDKNDSYYEDITDFRKAPKGTSDDGYLLNPSSSEFITLLKADNFFETIQLQRVNKK